MKKIIAALLAIAMLMCACCMAEEMSIDEQAKSIISTVNYIVNENTGEEQLFVSYEEMVEDEIYGFYTEDNTVQALLVANTDEKTIDSCSFICDDPDVMGLALNCTSLLPFAQLIVYGEDSDAKALQDDMLEMAEWIDENHPDALEAFESDSVYAAAYGESEFFHMNLMIVPMDDGVRMMASYYFSPMEAEESAE